MQKSHTQLVVISGASSGIGLALARHYLKNGAIVAAFARRGELLQILVVEFPDKVFCYALDVRDAVAIQNAAQDFMLRVGVPDIVIANAGVSCGTLTEYAEDIDAFQQVMDINVLGMVKTFQPFLAAMRGNSSPISPSEKGDVEGQGRPGGILVGIASVAGFRGLPSAGAYSASKAAAISYLESLRVELRGTGVKVVTICPGYIKTPMTAVNPYPMPFILDADDAAKRMARAIERRCSFSVIPWQMGLIGRAMKLLPNWLYDLILKRAPYKPRSF
jgi:NAD(P)-dependent dehydrogenase (short-subunit alcohol dehydrogenase family)